jgi:DNA-binding protein HU-beta
MSINQKELVKRIAQKVNQKDGIVEEIVNATLEEK